MSVYYVRLNQRANNYKNVATSSDTVVTSPAQPNPRPTLRSGLTINLTGGTTTVAAEQGLNTAGG